MWSNWPAPSGRHDLDFLHNQSARRRCGKRLLPHPEGAGHNVGSSQWAAGRRSLRGSGGGNCPESRRRVRFWIHGAIRRAEVSGACSVPSRSPSLRPTAFQTPGREGKETAALGKAAPRPRSGLLGAPRTRCPLGALCGRARRGDRALSHRRLCPDAWTRPYTGSRSTASQKTEFFSFLPGFSLSFF